ncbi:N-acetylaspartate synthetase isoform X2 [Hyla sarda]|uniref:N-acetylaspartate synthetase isoform X2 n=1 Tax=Hyla sarda TaxID=327740 RepID=UPI0024C3C30F|nr:N-acetylaspartate synthetase isoform X2 [Hyla sarda]
MLQSVPALLQYKYLCKMQSTFFPASQLQSPQHPQCPGSISPILCNPHHLSLSLCTSPLFFSPLAICMHFIPPKMVCETGILADDHSSIAGPQKDPLIVSSSQMWPPLPSAASTTSPLVPPTSTTNTTTSSGGAAEEEVFMKNKKEQQLYIREFQPSDQEIARRIFYEGIKERIPSSAFRGLKYQPLLQCLYALFTLICFVVTNSLMLACCMPIILLGMRYYFSRKIILHLLECALRTDMSDIEQYYMKQPVQERDLEQEKIVPPFHEMKHEEIGPSYNGSIRRIRRLCRGNTFVIARSSLWRPSLSKRVIN